MKGHIQNSKTTLTKVRPIKEETVDDKRVLETLKSPSSVPRIDCNFKSKYH